MFSGNKITYDKSVMSIDKVIVDFDRFNTNTIIIDTNGSSASSITKGSVSTALSMTYVFDAKKGLLNERRNCMHKLVN